MGDINPDKKNETLHLNGTVIKIAVAADNQTELTSNSVATFKKIIK